ncbi:FliC/FljB family flagellin [Pseudocitrobacter sp. RIT415]|nr:FliC/FljB family flagellin [Pseudocitrobacter sp. RIT 415]RAU46704.1 FliC/FljB family flagellin [Pseudocitrobacter sp. RIT 415]
MAQVINTNSLSLITQNNINKNQSALSSSIERLSSGLRINSAKDDAAGQAIANRFTSNIKGLTQAARNANDGISLAQTTEGALSEINNNLQRVRELTVQATTGTNSDSDLSSIQDEIKSRLEEIDRVSGQTQFNGVNVLAKDGTMKIQVGANDGQTISIDLQKIDSTTLGLTGFDVSTKANISTSAVTTGGTSTTTYADSATDVDVTTKATSLATDATITNLKFDNTNGKYYGTISSATDNTIDGDYELHVATDGSVTVAAADKQAGTAPGTALTSGKVQTATTTTTPGTAVDVTAAKTALAAAGADTTGLKLVQLSNTDSAGKVTNVGYGLQNDSGTIFATDYDGTTVTTPGAETVTYKDATGASVTAAVTLGGSDGKTKLVEAADGKTYGATALNGADLSDPNNTVKSVADNSKPLAALDDAIAMVDKFRSSLGAVQNRLDSAVTNLNNTTTNLSEAQSRIQDADYATEVSNMSKAQIIQQAGNSVLSKANQVPQQVLSLLQG